MKIKHRILTFALAGGFALFGLFSAASVPAAAAEITTAEQAELNTETDNYQETFVAIPGDGYTIPAIVSMPKGEIRGAVIMLHGTASSKNEAGDGYKTLAPKLAEAGIASIRFDFYGCGDSTVDYQNYCFDTAVGETLIVRDYLLTLIPAGTKIGLLGWSQGGTDALLASGEYPDAFQCVVTWAGAPDLSDMMTEQDYQTAMEKGYYTMTFDWRTPLNVGKQWCIDVKTTDVLSVFKNYTGPILALQGENDEDVDPKWNKLIAETSQNPASGFIYIPNTGHTFGVFDDNDDISMPTVQEATVQYFSKILSAK